MNFINNLVQNLPTTRLLILTAWMLLIFFMSSQVASTSSGLSHIFVEPIHSYTPHTKEGPVTFLVRKSAHMFLYLLLGLLMINIVKEYVTDKKRQIIYSVLFCCFYALSDEFHQLFVKGRSSELRDVLIDSVAAAIGVFVYYRFIQFNTKKKVTYVNNEK
jgi:VanZ family protein